MDKFSLTRLWQFTGLSVVSACWSIAFGQHEIPLSQPDKPDLQGFWTNASLTKMERDPAYAEFGLSIPLEQVEEITQNHPQVVRQDTDDNQVWKKL